MKLDLANGACFPAGEWGTWSLCVKFRQGGELLRISAADGSELLTCVFAEDALTVTLHYDANAAPLTLRSARVAGGGFALSATPARVALLADGKVLDEEWVLGKIPFGGSSCRGSASAVWEDRAMPDPPFVPETFTDLSHWKPDGENTNVGDCMPFADGDLYRLYYLFDRRHHRSKWGLGAHQWAQVSSRDLVHWVTHPMAVGIDEPWEGSICTGSHIKNGDTYYAFYAVRMSDRTPARLTWATSRDGEHFQKSGKYLSLGAPYESVSALDPKVFRTEDGRFHMLVTTSFAKENVGALAHLVSDDLEHWEQLDPFIRLEIPDQPECSDHIRFGDWYYLIYSNFGQAHWFRSKDPLGPWEAPEDNLVAAEDVIVPKGAVVMGRLIFTGFTREGKAYGGNFIQYEAIPDAAGDLTFRKMD